MTSPPSRPSPAASPTLAGLLPALGATPASIAAELTVAERTLGGGRAGSLALARAALTIQLACLRLAERPGWVGAVTGKVGRAQRAAAAADIAATADLVALTPPADRLPPWRIVAPEKLPVLRADYQAAQAVTGVRWFYLAAINFVETDFGRVVGPSSAGAQGPMQFLPATWAIYGHGDIRRARNAILAAARLLADHGAVQDIASALYAYNPSWRYVDAVLRIARQLRAHRRALLGYYSSPVIYRLARGWVLLPIGYGSSPAVRAIRLHL